MPVADYIPFEVHILGVTGHVCVKSETRQLSVPAAGV
jgi:hypothetical protein